MLRLSGGTRLYRTAFPPKIYRPWFLTRVFFTTAWQGSGSKRRGVYPPNPLPSQYQNVV
jgi:hypothetical protein